jgi:hypothetical protein
MGLNVPPGKLWFRKLLFLSPAMTQIGKCVVVTTTISLFVLDEKEQGCFDWSADDRTSLVNRQKDNQKRTLHPQPFMLRFVPVVQDASGSGSSESTSEKRGRPLTILLNQAVTTVGRDAASATVFLDSEKPNLISRKHATITRSATSQFTITAQGMNGITVN